MQVSMQCHKRNQHNLGWDVLGEGSRYSFGGVQCQEEAQSRCSQGSKDC